MDRSPSDWSHFQSSSIKDSHFKGCPFGWLVNNSICSHIYRMCKRWPPSCIGNVTDIDNLQWKMSTWRSKLIFHGQSFKMGPSKEMEGTGFADSQLFPDFLSFQIQDCSWARFRSAHSWVIFSNLFIISNDDDERILSERRRWKLNDGFSLRHHAEREGGREKWSQR